MNIGQESTSIYSLFSVVYPHLLWQILWINIQDIWHEQRNLPVQKMNYNIIISQWWIQGRPQLYFHLGYFGCSKDVCRSTDIIMFWFKLLLACLLSSPLSLPSKFELPVLKYMFHTLSQWCVNWHHGPKIFFLVKYQVVTKELFFSCQMQTFGHQNNVHKKFLLDIIGPKMKLLNLFLTSASNTQISYLWTIKNASKTCTETFQCLPFKRWVTKFEDWT